MEVQKIPFQEIPHLSTKDIAYATQDEKLKPFYEYDVRLDSFPQVIADKQKDPINRNALVEALQKQYEDLDTTDLVRANIKKLGDDHTFTVTTAHQPGLFTGPLYYIFKIISTINLAERLSKTYPDYQFVPIFISGAEDHDFEEVNHTRLFGKDITWENEESGGVGFMKTDSLKPVLAELKEILGDSEDAQRAYALVEEAYTSHERYGRATHHLVNQLFKDYGLVVVSMDDAALKHLFISYIKQEIFTQPSQKLINEAQEALEKVGFGEQAHAREINFFYLQDQLRSRIVQEGDHFTVLDTDIQWTRDQLEQEIDEHPERFSPNVVMRPIYQECVLPNLAYIGGGGELSYWLERKKQFAHFGLNFPMLIRRNSALWVDRGACKRMDKLGLSAKDIFEETESLIKRFVRDETEHEVDLGPEKGQLHQLFQAIAEKAAEIDPTLKKKTLAEGAKQLKSLENLEGRLMKAEKQRHETAINQIRSLKDKLFPGNGLQERQENFLNFYLRYGNEFFETLKEHLNPLEEGFVVILDR